jgi:hypothetical protein
VEPLAPRPRLRDRAALPDRQHDDVLRVVRLTIILVVRHQVSSAMPASLDARQFGRLQAWVVDVV